MAQASNTRLYPIDTSPELSDLLFGSNSKNFLISSVLDLINAQNLIQFEFSDGVNTEITRYTTGKFLTNNNTLNPLTFTKFYFNKSNVKPLDLSPLFGKLALTTNVVLRLEKQDNSNSFFEFKIVLIENFIDYFTINVIPSFYLGLLENNKKYNITFSIKSSASGGDSGIVRSIFSISTNTTAGAVANTDYVYNITGTTILTLPTAVGNTNKYTIKNAGVGVITILFTSGQNADDSTIITLNPGVSLPFVSTNTNWIIT